MDGIKESRLEIPSFWSREFQVRFPRFAENVAWFANTIKQSILEDWRFFKEYYNQMKQEISRMIETNAFFLKNIFDAYLRFEEEIAKAM